MCFRILKVIIVSLCYSLILSVQIGTISNVQYFASIFNQTYLNTSCTECTCLAMNISAVGWNCLLTNRTCQLIRNYSLNDTGVKMTINISFYFREPPSEQSIKSINYTCSTLRWNSNYTIVAGIDGSSGNSAMQLKKPHGITFDPVTKSIFIADKDNHRVQKFLPNNDTGQTINVNLLNINPNMPIALIWANTTEALYIAYEDKNIVVRVYPSNTSRLATIIAGSVNKGDALSELDSPSGIAVDKYEKFLYISDRENARIVRWDLTNLTQNGTLIAGKTNVHDNKNDTLNKPCGITLNNANTLLFIADRDNNRIQKLTLNTGTLMTVAGDPDGNAGTELFELKKPFDIAIDLFDNIYVVDSENDRILMFCNNSKNGTDILPNINFKKPTGIFIDESFNLFISDKENARILKFNFIP